MDVKKIGISICVIPKEHILQMDFSMLLRHISLISLPQIKAGETNYSKLVISIDGYNDDSRPLWQIPEVIKWFKELHLNHPYMPLFLTPGSVQVYFQVLIPIAKNIIPESLRDKNEPVGLLLHTFEGRNAYFSEALGDDYDRLQYILNAADKSVADAVINLVNGVQEPL